LGLLTLPAWKCRRSRKTNRFLLPGALNDTWKWLEKDLTLITVPGAGHLVHRDSPEPEFVTGRIIGWLTGR
jgi:pimeloyl-ACP methyl ester carboxylesterase